MVVVIVVDRLDRGDGLGRLRRSWREVLVCEGSRAVRGLGTTRYCDSRRVSGGCACG